MPEPDERGDERRQRLLEAARLSAVGRIVPAVAHDLSTPLAAIALRAESLESALADPQRQPPPEKLARYLRSISEETQRCKLLLSTLQEFARRAQPAAGPVEIAPLCHAAVRLVQHEAMRRQLQLHLELQEPLPSLEGHAPRLGHALLALLLNAIDASSGGSSVVLAAAAGADAVSITVSDSGPGLSAGARQRLFEPLASTQPPDRAAGLGLMACRAIAEAHGGSVALGSTPEGGCRAELRLPLRRRSAGGGGDGGGA